MSDHGRIITTTIVLLLLLFLHLCLLVALKEIVKLTNTLSFCLQKQAFLKTK